MFSEGKDSALYALESWHSGLCLNRISERLEMLSSHRLNPVERKAFNVWFHSSKRRGPNT